MLPIRTILNKGWVRFVIAVIVAIIGYYGYKLLTTTVVPPRYVTATATRGTLVVSVSGTGQVSSSNQIDIKPQVSGNIIYVGVKDGQEVKAAELIAQIDAREAQKSIRDAEVNLESAKLSLQKLVQPATALALVQAENNLARTQESKASAESDLKRIYEDGFNNISNSYCPALVSAKTV